MNRVAASLCAAVAAGGLSLVEGPPASPETVRKAIETGDFQTAISAGERLVQSQPASSVANDLLGRAYGGRALESGPLAQIGLARKARAAFARAVALDSENAVALADLATYDLRAPGFLGGNRARARETASKVVLMDPARGHELLGAVAEVDGDLSAAEAQYRLAAESPPPIRGRRALSEFLLRRRRYDEARAIWRGPDPAAVLDATAVYELAGVALSSGQELGAAFDALERVSRAEFDASGPRPAEIQHRLGLLAKRLGRREAAIARLSEALQMEPRHSAWQKELDELSR